MTLKAFSPNAADLRAISLWSLPQIGTHTDAPSHVVGGASNSWRTDDIPFERLMGPAVVIDIT